MFFNKSEYVDEYSEILVIDCIGPSVHQKVDVGQKQPTQAPLMTEGQPVAVVGNLAEISKSNSGASAATRDSYDPVALDISHAVGRAVDQDPSIYPQNNHNLHASHNVPINHVSDYDVLDLDLAGLKQISRTGYTPENSLWQGSSPPAGNFPLQISQGKLYCLFCAI